MKENTGRIVAQLPVEVATFLLNEKRESIHAIERRQQVEVQVPLDLVRAFDRVVEEVAAHHQAAFAAEVYPS